MPSELLKPVSWTDTWKYGLVTNIDEPFSAPDGSSIGEDRAGGHSARFQLSDIQNIREGIDSPEGMILKLRVQSETDPLEQLPDATLYVFWLIGGSVYGSYSFVVPDRGMWDNYQLSFPLWDAHIQALSVAQLNTMEVILQVQSRLPDTTLVLVEVDTLEVEITYSIPAPIVISPDERALTLSTGTPDPRIDSYVRPSSGGLLHTPKGVDLVRRNIERIDSVYRFLVGGVPVLNTTFYPDEKILSLSGKLPVPDFGQAVAEDDLVLTGKVPDVAATRNLEVTVPRLRLRLWPQNVADEDTAMPSRLRLGVSGKSVVIARSWTITPDAGGLVLDGWYFTRLDFASVIAEGATTLTGENTEAISSENAADAASLTLTGQAPDLFLSLTLDLVGKVPVLGTSISVPETALALAGSPPIIRAVFPETGSARLTGKRPALAFATVLRPGDHGIISLSARYCIEHIATPTDELEF